MKLVFIDIDNTLLDFDEYVKNTMKNGFEHFGLKAYQPFMYDIFCKENTKLWCRIEKGDFTFSELEKTRWNIVFKKLGIEFDGTVFEKYFRLALNESAIPVRGAYEMLSYIKEKYIVAAASNGPYNQQIHRLDLADMTKYFDYIFISEKVGASKPSKDFFEYAFKRINENKAETISPHDCIIIGDSLTSDIAGGKQYGMKTCLFRRNLNMKILNSVDYVVDDLRKVADFL